MIIIKIIALITLLATLSLSTRFLINSFKKISSRFDGSEFALSGLIIGMGTSLPELIIGLEAALKGKPSLSLGNVLGSNIANLSLVIGGATLIAGRIKIIDVVLKKDIYYTFLIAAAPLLLLSDGQLTRLDGLILLALYLSWQSLIFARKEKAKKPFWWKIKEKMTAFFSPAKPFFIMIASLLILLISADLLVRISSDLASNFKIPYFILGVFILGVGSSIPELAFSIRAIKDKETGIVLGDLLGSVVANSSLILAITVLIAPITLFQTKEYLVISLFFLLTFLLFYIFIKTKRTLEKWEGAFLVASYLILLALQFG